MKTPCDYGECPYDAEYAEACRVYCGLGVDVACYEDECDDEEFDDGYNEMEEDMALLNSIEGRYIRSSTYGDYGPSNPWDAPGMSAKDFI